MDYLALGVILVLALGPLLLDAWYHGQRRDSIRLPNSDYRKWGESDHAFCRRLGLGGTWALDEFNEIAADSPKLSYKQVVAVLKRRIQEDVARSAP